MGTGAEGKDLQFADAQQSGGNRHKFCDQVRQLVGGAHRVLRDKRADFSQIQVVGAVKHTAVGVAPAVDQVVAGFLRRAYIHHRAVKVLGYLSLRSFRAEVAQEYHQSVAAGVFRLVHRLEHIVFIFHCGHHFIKLAALFGVALHNRLSAALGKRDDKAVAAYRDDSQFYLGDVLKHIFSSYLITLFLGLVL